MAFDNYSRVTTSVTFTNANVSDVTFSDSSPYTATFSYSSISDQLESTLEDKDQLMIWFIFDTDADSATVSDLSDADAKTLMQIPNDRWTIDTSAKTITLLDMAVGNDGTGTVTAGGFVRPGISTTLANQTIIVQRSTYQLDELVSWVSGTRITSRQLNLSSTQLLHLIQELNSTLENSTISTLPSEIPTSFSFGNQALSLVNSITSADTNDSSNEKIIMNGGNVGTTSSILEGQDAATAFVKISGQGVVQLLDNNSGTPDATEYIKLDPTVIGSSSNSIEVYDGATKFAVNGNGLVGIGTTSPQRPLHITESGDSIIRVEGGASNAVGVEFINSGKETTQLYSTDENLQIFTNGAERMRVQSDGKVGIGTATNLNDQLTVGSNTDGFTANVSGAITTIRLGSHASGSAAGRFDYDRSTGKLTYKEGSYESAGSELVTVDLNGRVGINESTPAAALHLRTEENQTISGTVTNIGAEQAFYTAAWDTTQTGDLTITITHDNTAATTCTSVHEVTYTTQDDANAADYQVFIFKILVSSTSSGSGQATTITGTSSNMKNGTGVADPTVSSSHTGGVTTITIADASSSEADQDHRTLFIHSLGRNIVSYAVAQA